MKKKAKRVWRPNSAEVARLAGVSRSAVSRTFTPGAYVSAETRRKVLAAAEMLNYSPNAIARSLSKKSTGLIGMVAADLDHPFLAQLLAQIGSTLQAKGYGILLLLADSHNLDQLLPRVLSYQVDGVLISVSTLESHLAISLQQAGWPVVMVNEIDDLRILSSVASDNHAGGALVAELLCRTGHRRIAYVSGRPDTSSSRDRGRGFMEYLARRELALCGEEPGYYTHDGGAAAARKLLSRSPRPDALFCANDTMALGALEVARVEFMLKVPEDLSIVGYDNIEPAGWPLHDLTTIDSNVPEMARVAVDMLTEKIVAGKTDVDRRLISPRLIERGTIRSAIKDDSPKGGSPRVLVPRH